MTGLRIGTFVLNNDLRHPVPLAQELGTIDLVTDGRLEIGLGAGWNRPEYDAIAMPFDVPRLRIARMEASVRMLKQGLAEGRIDHPADEAYAEIHVADLPVSVQRPHPPILVGGGGPRLLRFAAREADIVALNPRSLREGMLDPADVLAAAIDRKMGWVREAAGERWSELEINVVVFDVDPEFRSRSGPPPPRTHGIGDDDLPHCPHYLAGDESEVVEQLLARRERWGISYVAMRPAHLPLLVGVIGRLRGMR